MPQRYTFTGEIHPARGGGAYVDVPFNVEETFGEKRPAVKATMEGVTLSWRLMKMGGECHVIGIPKAIRDQAGKTYGDQIHVTLEADHEVREVVVPPDLQKALKASKPALAFFESLPYTGRKEYARWITDAKKEETRARRLEKAIEMLLAGKRGV